MTVTSETVSGEDYLTDYLTPGSLPQQANEIVDQAVMTISGEPVSAVGEEGFVSRYKWLLVGGALAAGYVYMHKQDPKKYPLPAELSKLVR